MSSRSLGIEHEAGQVGTVSELTGIFESIASMRIGKIKDRVARSQQFFSELWQIYTQLRVDPQDRLTGKNSPTRDKPNVFLALTSEGGLSGDIDGRIVKTVLENIDPTTTDLIVIGAHGATQFVQNHAKIKRYFRLPDIDQAIDVSPIVDELLGYKQPTVWFQRYVSLSVQEVGRIDLLGRVRTLATGAEAAKTTDIISPRDYLFEPSVDDVVRYLESVMMEIALSQVILESRLAQYASRFTAMSAAKKRAKELQTLLVMNYNRARRGEADDRIKEIVNAMNALHAN
ncbi:MAG TPA: F0F1 ATP synthase subunit gamma [Candidatus Saccharimonadia bacterium]|nr:F0F1 ATP synthase subunit gamma [Candidatus Saccharimonadia bacterium]